MFIIFQSIILLFPKELFSWKMCLNFHWFEGPIAIVREGVCRAVNIKYWQVQTTVNMVSNIYGEILK